METEELCVCLCVCVWEEQNVRKKEKKITNKFMLDVYLEAKGYCYKLLMVSWNIHHIMIHSNRHGKVNGILRKTQFDFALSHLPHNN